MKATYNTGTLKLQLEQYLVEHKKAYDDEVATYTDEVEESQRLFAEDRDRKVKIKEDFFSKHTEEEVVEMFLDDTGCKVFGIGSSQRTHCTYKIKEDFVNLPEGLEYSILYPFISLRYLGQTSWEYKNTKYVIEEEDSELSYTTLLDPSLLGKRSCGVLALGDILIGVRVLPVLRFEPYKAPTPITELLQKLNTVSAAGCSSVVLEDKELITIGQMLAEGEE